MALKVPPLNGHTAAIAAGVAAAAALGLAALFNAVGGAPEPPPGAAPVSEFVDLESMTRADGSTVQVAVLRVEDYDAYRQSRGAADGLTEFVHGYNNDLRHELRTYLESAGVPAGAAAAIAQRMADGYHETGGYKQGNHAPIYQSARGVLVDAASQVGPAAQLIGASGWVQDLHGAGANARFCAITHVSDVYSGADWLRGFLQLPAGASVALPREYGDEFASFVLNHERAHCMLGDEAQSDYVAARIMLLEHPDPAKATAFLQLMTDLRRVTTLLGAPGFSEYDGTAAAIETAVRDHAAADGGSPDAIMAAARTAGPFDAAAVSGVRQAVHASHPGAVEGRQFGALAAAVAAQAPSATRDAVAASLTRISVATSPRAGAPRIAARGPGGNPAG